MKERIKELADQCITINDSTTVPVDKDFDYEKFAEMLIREYSYDVMNLHGAKPERVQYAAKCWGVEV